MQILTPTKTKKKLNPLILFGIISSSVWLFLSIIYLVQQMTWITFLALPLEEIGSYLGGVFSPLAFLWLVIGFFIQQSEILENARNIETQAQQSNLDNFLKMSEIIYQHLGVITGYIFMSCREEFEEASEVALDFEDIWSRSGTGDTGIFARNIIRYQIDPNGEPRDIAIILFSTEIRQRHSKNYKRVFENLLVDATQCDTTGSLNDALTNGTVWGILYKLICEKEAEASNQVEQTETSQMPEVDKP